MLGVLTALVAMFVAAPATGWVEPSATAAAETAAPGASGPRIESRGVVFDVENANTTSVLCLSDGRSYELRGRLVGPVRDLDGLGGTLRVNLLVHDIGTGGWFWRMPGKPAHDYATRLAEQGETSLVLDRLGYGASRLDDGDATCLGAQADMLHQVVQHLVSGKFAYTDPADGSAPAAAHVVTHGHGVGAAIAQLEAATYDDVAGLVLMSWTDTGATPVAVRHAARQARDCLTADFAPFAETRADFRDIMFSSAPAALQRAAARRQSDDPCGDVASLAGLGLGAGASQVDAPVLLLYGSKDKLIRPGARERQASAYPTDTTMKVFRGAGSSLPLEKQAGRVRAAVLRWLD